MLQTLRVKDLAIVENIRVEFDGGLNVLTGETGAGKSIVAGALGLVLGDRSDKNMIRAGEEKCGVEAAFHLAESSDIDAALEELGIDACEDGRLIIRRIVSASGTSRNLVNDCPTTVQALKRIGDLLVDMHGPHDHQSLLSQDFQIDLLDSFGHLWDTRSTYEEAYRRMIDLQNRRRELDGDDQDITRQIDMLSFQVKEIENADLAECDEEELQKEHSLVANAHQILQLADGIRNALTEAESSAFNSLVAAQNALGELSGIVTEAVEWRKEAESITVQIQELSGSLSSHVHGVDANPERLQWLEDRMALLHKLKRKYGSSVQEMLLSLDKARKQLEDLETRGERLAKIDAELTDARANTRAAGRKLAKQRQRVAKSLAEAITAELHDLGFSHGVFDVELRDAEPGPAGMDEVEFGFAPNVGEPMRALRAIASSGEISRVMLATKAVLAAHDRIPVLVFDEIDANVGGEMGNAIGSKLTTVARNHQVLCITHLPQVAVHGTTHFVVTKEVRDGRTCTDMRPVDSGERAEEVARMLGGRDLTTVTLKHAKEMLRTAESR